MSDLSGRMFRSHWSPRLLVEVVADGVEIRIGASRKTTGVLYRRIDEGRAEDEPLTVRPILEFMRTFEAAD